MLSCASLENKQLVSQAFEFKLSSERVFKILIKEMLSQKPLTVSILKIQNQQQRLPQPHSDTNILHFPLKHKISSEHKKMVDHSS